MMASSQERDQLSDSDIFQTSNEVINDFFVKFDGLAAHKGPTLVKKALSEIEKLKRLNDSLMMEKQLQQDKDEELHKKSLEVYTDAIKRADREKETPIGAQF